MANDIWGLRYDHFYAKEGETSVWDCKTMAEVIAKENVPVCIMHNRPKAVYQDFIPDVLADLKESVAIGVSAGIPKEKFQSECVYPRGYVRDADHQELYGGG